MTEAEWLGCGDPKAMLKALRRTSQRKLRLFAVACCRSIVDYFPDARVWQTVLEAEICAEGQTSPEALVAARTHAKQAAKERRQRQAQGTLCFTGGGLWAYYAALHAAEKRARRAAEGALHAALTVLVDAVFLPLNLDPYRDFPRYYEVKEVHRQTEQIPLAGRVHDIFGNPFRPEAVDLAWLSWNGRIIPPLAQAIYDESSFERLPILADALEEAGCTDAAILNHCRGPGPHVRGCWVVDLLLDKR